MTTPLLSPLLTPYRFATHLSLSLGQELKPDIQNRSDTSDILWKTLSRKGLILGDNPSKMEFVPDPVLVLLTGNESAAVMEWEEFVDTVWDRLQPTPFVSELTSCKYPLRTRLEQNGLNDFSRKLANEQRYRQSRLGIDPIGCMEFLLLDEVIEMLRMAKGFKEGTELLAHIRKEQEKAPFSLPTLDPLLERLIAELDDEMPAPHDYILEKVRMLLDKAYTEKSNTDEVKRLMEFLCTNKVQWFKDVHPAYCTIVEKKARELLADSKSEPIADVLRCVVDKYSHVSASNDVWSRVSKLMAKYKVFAMSNDSRRHAAAEAVFQSVLNPRTLNAIKPLNLRGFVQWAKRIDTYTARKFVAAVEAR